MRSIELVDRVQRVSEVLCWQAFALLSKVFFVLYPVTIPIVPVCTLKHVFQFVLLLTVDLDMLRLLVSAKLVGYVMLQ
jgi:hypothetical protein